MLQYSCLGNLIDKWTKWVTVHGVAKSRIQLSMHAYTEFYGSVQFSCAVVSDYILPHGLQYPRLTSPSPTPRTCSNSCPLSQGCHQTILSSVIPFSSCLQSFPASGYFQMNQVAKVLEFQFQHQSFQGIYKTDFFRIDFDPLAVQGTLKSLLQHPSSKASILL